jgi:2-polyprenyl-6-methoxyphenol hydroxylase-like FAD-dependent oxidoreductase
MQTDVLIVGAGPTGLMLANQLARRGIRARIIDRHSGPAQQTRAMAVHARTLEIYSKLGIADEALELGQRGTGANMWTNGKWAARIPLREMGANLSPFPFVLMLGQDENERIMGEKLSDWGLSVEWNTELIGMEQEAGHVTAVIRRPDGSNEHVSVAYVAGCDGARSSVREFSGIKFPGAPYEHVFFVADTEATGPMVPSELNVYLWKDGFHLFFPMRGVDRWRVIGILPKELRSKADLAFAEVSPAITKEAGAQLAFKSCSWFSTYRIHHRCVERFRDRRIFLLGDAAHVHSPMGGQGMNTGLQDAYNLAWKLALVVRGQADEHLLDTYEDERLPVAQQLLRSTDRAFTMVVSDSWRAGLFRTRVLTKIVAFAMKRAQVRLRAFRALSQIGIRYSRSRLSQGLAEKAAGAPRPGDRFPWLKLHFQRSGVAEDVFQKLDDTRFNLIVIGQRLPAGSATDLGEVSTYVIPDDPANADELARVRIPSPSFFVVRPDGYIGLAGARLEAGALRRYFSEIGILAGAPTTLAA